jgi:hypothetical protein
MMHGGGGWHWGFGFLNREVLMSRSPGKGGSDETLGTEYLILVDRNFIDRGISQVSIWQTPAKQYARQIANLNR